MGPRNSEVLNFANLWMDVLGASSIFIAVIDNWFGVAGLKDNCIEASLTGIGSADRVMKGK